MWLALKGLIRLNSLLSRSEIRQQSLNLFVDLILVDFHVSWLNGITFVILLGGLLVILMSCMNFLSQFINVKRILMLTVFSSYIENLEFIWGMFTFVLWSEWVLESIGTFLGGLFLISVPIQALRRFLLFLMTVCFLEAFRPCVEWIPINYWDMYFFNLKNIYIETRAKFDLYEHNHTKQTC